MLFLYAVLKYLEIEMLIFYIRTEALLGRVKQSETPPPPPKKHRVTYIFWFSCKPLCA